MDSIIGIGNVLVDALYRIDDEKILEEFGLRSGGMFLIDDEKYARVCNRMKDAPKERTTGGSACNTMLALAALGTPAALIGKTGDDEDGRFFTDEFHRQGVRTILVTHTRPTGVASTFITPDGQRTFGTFLGAAADLTADEVEPLWFDGYAYLYIEGYLVQNHALINAVVDTARRAGLKVCLDMASWNIVEADRDFFASLLERTDIVFANEEEARAFTGKEPREALDVLSRICPTAVVKVGKDGVIAAENGNVVSVPAEKVEHVVDTTAAGDYFSAGFLHARAAGRPLRECLEAGGILAGEIIQVVGTHLADDVWERIRTRINH